MSRRPEELLVLRMIAVIVGYNILVQILLLFISDALLYQSLGLWIGAFVGIGMVIHMKRTAEDTLDIGVYGGKEYAKKKALIRMVTVVLTFGVAFYFQIGDVLTAFIGVMGLKVSAYLQPFINRYTDSK